MWPSPARSARETLPMRRRGVQSLLLMVSLSASGCGSPEAPTPPSTPPPPAETKVADGAKVPGKKGSARAPVKRAPLSTSPDREH